MGLALALALALAVALGLGMALVAAVQIRPCGDCEACLCSDAGSRGAGQAIWLGARMGSGQRQQQEQGGQEGTTSRGQGDRPFGAQRVTQSVAKAERGQSAKRQVAGPCSKACVSTTPPLAGLDKLARMCRRRPTRDSAWAIPHVPRDLKKS